MGNGLDWVGKIFSSQALDNVCFDELLTKKYKFFRANFT